jgi:hypothetical protein
MTDGRNNRQQQLLKAKSLLADSRNIIAAIKGILCTQAAYQAV